MNPLPLVLAELRRSWAGALALLVVVAVAVSLGVAVTAQERALRQGSARAADDFDLLIGAPGSEAQLVLSAVYLQEGALPLMEPGTWDDLGRFKGVAWAAPLIFGDSWRGRPVVGTTADFVTRGGRRGLAEGRLFQAEGEAVAGGAVPLAVGAKLTLSHGHSREDGRTLPGEAKHDGHELTVVGRAAPTGTPYDRAILVPAEALWEAHGLATGRPPEQRGIGPPWPEATGSVPAIVVKAASVADAYRLRSSFRTGGRTMAVFPAEVLVQLYATLGDVKVVLGAMALVTQAVVLACVLVCVFAVAATRRRLVAVLRAMGAPRRFIFAFVWTGVSVVLVGGVLAGVALGALLSVFVSNLLARASGIALSARVSHEEWMLALALAALGLVLAAWPAVTTYRRSVIAGLRED